jgi:predicted acyl esterase
VALMDLRGTRNTSGCQTYGDRDEVFDAVDVVDHIADQPWSNGKVGLTGGSYDGTIATGAAVEQPISGKHKNAVAAVIPIRAIDRWYDYHFLNGVASSQHARPRPCSPPCSRPATTRTPARPAAVWRPSSARAASRPSARPPTPATHPPTRTRALPSGASATS